jgi:hypothetical protein
MVATDWAPVIQTGIGAAAALGGGVIGAWLQGRSQERIEQRRIHHEERADRHQRRDRAAEVLAEVSELLRDAFVERTLAQYLSPESLEGATGLDSDRLELQQRHKAAREQLILMAIREPAPEVRRLARELEKAMDSSLHSVSYKRASRDAGEVAAPILAELAAKGEQDHFKALALLDELVEAL